MNSGFNDALKIAGKRHDLIGLHVYDEREAELPNMGLTRVIDTESSQELWVDTSDKKLRDNYAKLFKENQAQLKACLAKAAATLYQ